KQRRRAGDDRGDEAHAGFGLVHFCHRPHHSAAAAAGFAVGCRRCRSRRVHRLKRSRERYTTGGVYKVSIWLTISPPTIEMPSGRRSSAPSPLPSASGTAASSAAIVVIMIGRKRSRQASNIASREFLPR